MAIKISSDKDKTDLSIDGELTIYTALEYKNYLIEKYTGGKTLEIDLGGVDEIDTSGIQLILALTNKISADGDDINIIASNETVNSAFAANNIFADMLSTSTGANDES